MQNCCFFFIHISCTHWWIKMYCSWYIGQKHVSEQDIFVQTHAKMEYFNPMAGLNTMMSKTNSIISILSLGNPRESTVKIFLLITELRQWPLTAKNVQSINHGSLLRKKIVYHFIICTKITSRKFSKLSHKNIGRRILVNCSLITFRKNFLNFKAKQ